MKRALMLVSAIAAAGIVATAGSATPRSGALHVTKECSEYQGQAGEFCTITSSNVPQIKAGMRVVYLQAFGQNGLDSDIVLLQGHGSAAFGHVVLERHDEPGHVLGRHRSVRRVSRPMSSSPRRAACGTGTGPTASPDRGEGRLGAKTWGFHERPRP